MNDIAVKERFETLDIIKAIACIAVVFIHISFPENVGVYTKAIARFAVPVFFMVSGYFWFAKRSVHGHFNLYKKVKYLFGLAMVSGIIYFCVDILKAKLIDKVTIRNYLINTFNLGDIIRFFITNTPLVYSARWFLFSLIYTYLFFELVSLLFARIGNKIKFNSKSKYLLCITTMFLLSILMCCELLGVYKNAIGFYVQGTSTFVTFHNLFLFRAVPFFLIGGCIKLWQEQLKRMPNRIFWLGIIVGGIITIIERYTYDTELYCYFGTIITSICLLCIGTVNQTGFSVNKVNKRNRFKDNISFIGKELSLYVYLCHGIMVYFLVAVGIIFRLQGVFLWLRPILAVFLSLAVALLIYKVQFRKRRYALKHK